MCICIHNISIYFCALLFSCQSEVFSENCCEIISYISVFSHYTPKHVTYVFWRKICSFAVYLIIFTIFIQNYFANLNFISVFRCSTLLNYHICIVIYNICIYVLPDWFQIHSGLVVSILWKHKSTQPVWLAGKRLGRNTRRMITSPAWNVHMKRHTKPAVPVSQCYLPRPN
jgi:hypothetical protein